MSSQRLDESDAAVDRTMGPSFSLIIPARNEALHIADALRSALAQSLPPLEIIVVDDGSDDATPEIVEHLASRSRIQLVRKGRSAGAGAARNTGIDRAQGDVVVFLDADDQIPPDFLERLRGRYVEGVDAVAVESRIADQTTAVGRFQEGFHRFSAARAKVVGYTGAFSCRRGAAASVRFPEIPGCGGEDGAFVADLHAAGFACVKADDIVVELTTSVTVGELWEQAMKRGRAAARVDRLLAGRSRSETVARRGAAGVRALVTIAVVVPLVRDAIRHARHSPRGFGDLGAFWLLEHVQLVGHAIGGLTGSIADDHRPTS